MIFCNLLRKAGAFVCVYKGKHQNSYFDLVMVMLSREGGGEFTNFFFSERSGTDSSREASIQSHSTQNKTKTDSTFKIFENILIHLLNI